jgi:hypothetical protein
MIARSGPNLFRASLYFTGLYLLFRGSAPEAAAAIPDPAAMMPLQAWAAAAAAGHPLWAEALRFLFVALTAFGLVRVVIRHSIYLEKTFVPALIYLLVAMGGSSSPLSPQTAFTAWLLVFAIDQLILSHKRDERFGHFLQGAVALGAMPLLDAPTVVFAALLPVGFVLFRQRWRGAVASVIGYLFPMALCCYVGWGMRDPFLEPVYRLAGILTTASGAPPVDPWRIVLAALFVGTAVWSLMLFAFRSSPARSRTKRGTSLLVWTAIAAGAMMALPCRNFEEMLPVAAVPLAALIPGSFIQSGGWAANLLMVVLFVAVIGYHLRAVLAGILF